ncbi:MAG: hypothetical protein N2234_08135 [Planctomycetota bacterium]|nr:hypothetical protein [Planctomycetota bacterium]
MNSKKYFLNILGQDRATDFLSRILHSKHIHHGFIFLGPEGVGRFSTAIHFASALNNIPFENWQSCPRILVLSRKEKESIGIDTVRDELLPFFALRTEPEHWRVAIVKEAETLTEDAQNALLKTLEEPPLRSVLIFIASRASLLATVVSRCITIRFNPLSESHIIEILKKEGFSEEKRQKAATLSSGSVKNALFLLKHNLSDLTLECVETIISANDAFDTTCEILLGLSRSSAANFCDILLPLVAARTQDLNRRLSLCEHIITLKRAIEANANIRLATLAFSSALENLQ